MQPQAVGDDLLARDDAWQLLGRVQNRKKNCESLLLSTVVKSVTVLLDMV